MIKTLTKEETIQLLLSCASKGYNIYCHAFHENIGFNEVEDGIIACEIDPTGPDYAILFANSKLIDFRQFIAEGKIDESGCLIIDFTESITLKDAWFTVKTSSLQCNVSKSINVNLSDW